MVLSPTSLDWAEIAVGLLDNPRYSSTLSLKSVHSLFLFFSPAPFFTHFNSLSSSDEQQHLSQTRPYLSLFCGRRQCGLEAQVSAMLQLPQMGGYRVYLSLILGVQLFFQNSFLYLSFVAAHQLLLQSPFHHHCVFFVGASQHVYHHSGMHFNQLSPDCRSYSLHFCILTYYHSTALFLFFEIFYNPLYFRHLTFTPYTSGTLPLPPILQAPYLYLLLSPHLNA